jgi:very-short-patch-repair endonuclease
LLAAGVGAGAIDKRVSRGWLRVIHRGVYAVGHSAISHRGRWTAAVLASGPGALLSHRSAGQAWGLVPLARGPIDAIRPGKFRGRPGIRAHRSSVPADERVVRYGIPMTSAMRTLLDLAAILTPSHLEKALNEAEVQRLTDRLSLPDLLGRYPRRRGSAVLRELLAGDATTRGVTRSELEDRFAALLDDMGFPGPRFNADVRIGGRFFEVDCLWPKQRLIVELDGRAAHGTRRAFERDRERDRLLQSDGWRVVRITWRQLRDDASAIVADLRRMLRPGSGPPTL